MKLPTKLKKTQWAVFELHLNAVDVYTEAEGALTVPTKVRYELPKWLCDEMEEQLEIAENDGRISIRRQIKTALGI